MRHRHTYEFVKQYIEAENGYELLEESYKNARTKLKIKCNNGHIYETPFITFYRGCRCRVCSRAKRKFTHEFVKEEYRKECYILLSPTYNNNSEKLKVQCDKGHRYEGSYGNFQQGTRCPICSFDKQKLAYEFVKKEVERKRCKLRSTEYINYFSKLKIQCDEGHDYEVTFANFQQGYGCPVCSQINKYGSNNPNGKGGISLEPYCYIFSDNEFKDYIKERDGYICLNPTCSGKSKRLAIHHIDYNKKNCIQENLITLCISCNSKANINREWHTQWYRLIMMHRYKFKYEEIV
jgi:hypothetical protein